MSDAAHTISAKPAVVADFNWEDPLDLEGQLTEEERMIRDSVREFAEDKLASRVKSALSSFLIWRGAQSDGAATTSAISSCSGPQGTSTRVLATRSRKSWTVWNVTRSALWAFLALGPAVRETKWRS